MNYIMVIDDSPTIRMSIGISIEDQGYPVMNAEDGIDGLKKICELKNNGDDVALCITDINMPNMDGIEFIREFRKTDRFTPILVLTTESGSEKVQEGKELGASGWVVKPFQPVELIGAIKKLIK